jgi:uncharacterized protein (TIGR02271 family)
MAATGDVAVPEEEVFAGSNRRAGQRREFATEEESPMESGTRAGLPVTEAYEWRGRTIIGQDGEKIGTLDEVLVDAETGSPEWALVNTGLFGTKTSYVPLVGASPQGGDVHVPYTKDQVKDAPGGGTDGELSTEEEAELFAHYGLPYPGPAAQPAVPAGQGTTGGGETDDAMTRSEEELAVGKRSRERGRARLRKYVVTEEVQQTVPVQREEIRVEREPITEGNVDEATSGPEISEAEHEVVLHEEEPVVEKRTVPKERVRLEKDAVTDEEQVSEQIRKERIEAEGDAADK